MIKVNAILITIIDVIGKKNNEFSFSMRMSPGNLPNQLINQGAKLMAIPSISRPIPTIMNAFPEFIQI